jgi:hypothetical protein
VRCKTRPPSAPLPEAAVVFGDKRVQALWRKRTIITLTKQMAQRHTDSTSKWGVGAPEQIEVSPEMIRAALSVFEDLEGEVSRASLAEELCRALAAIALRK